MSSNNFFSVSGSVVAIKDNINHGRVFVYNIVQRPDGQYDLTENGNVIETGEDFDNLRKTAFFRYANSLWGVFYSK